MLQFWEFCSVYACYVLCCGGVLMGTPPYFGKYSHSKKIRLILLYTVTLFGSLVQLFPTSSKTAHKVNLD